jgi:hypothetical protein
VGPGLPQEFLPFISIRCHTPPGFYAQNSDVLPHTHSSRLNVGLPTFLVPSGLVLNTFLIILFSLARIRCPVSIISRNQNSKIPSQATPFNHPNIFTFTLQLSEGLASKAWEPLNKMILFFPPHTKVSLTFPRTFHFHLPF